MRLRLRRVRQDRTQQALARRAGLPAPCRCDMEKDRAEPLAVTLKGLALALAVRRDDLLGITARPPPWS